MRMERRGRGRRCLLLLSKLSFTTDLTQLPPNRQNLAMVAISQSGEMADTPAVLRKFKELNTGKQAPVIQKLKTEKILSEVQKILILKFIIMRGW